MDTLTIKLRWTNGSSQLARSLLSVYRTGKRGGGKLQMEGMSEVKCIPRENRERSRKELRGKELSNNDREI